MTSGRLEVSLSLADKRASKSQLGSVLLLACSGIRRFFLGQTVSAAGYPMNQQPAREPLLMPFIISLQATLWRSFIMPEMILHRHPERMWRTLSTCWQSGHWRLVDL